MSTTMVERALAATPSRVGQALSDLPEDQWLERKSARVEASELAKTMIGFANADGGFIVVGLRDGEVEGIGANPRRQNEHLQANLDFCVPPVQTEIRYVDCINEKDEPDRLLVFDISPSEVVPANQRDEVFLRVGDENRRLTFSQRKELLYDKGQANYEARPSEAGFDALEEDLLEEYVDALEASDGIRVLQARGLATEDRLTIAGCLLFAESPQRFFPEAFIRIVRYRGRGRGSGSRQQVTEDVRAEGPIPAQIVAAREHTKRLQPLRRALIGSGRFGDVALGLVDASQPLNATRFARNPRIARVCSDLNFGQELGEGIRRMFDEMRAAGLNDPIYRQTSGSVELTLLAEPVDRELDARLPERARAIAAALRREERLSTGEVTELLGVSRPVAQRELGALKDAEIIEWVGKSPQDPRAYWRLKPT